MALEVQHTTRASHPHLLQPFTCKSRLLHHTAPSSKHIASPLQIQLGTPPAQIDATITSLLSLFPAHQQTDGDVTKDKLAPMIEMQGPGPSSAYFPRPGREYLPAIAPRKRKASPSSDSSHNTSLTSKSVAGISRTRLPPRSRFGCW